MSSTQGVDFAVDLVTDSLSCVFLWKTWCGISAEPKNSLQTKLKRGLKRKIRKSPRTVSEKVSSHIQPPQFVFRQHFFSQLCTPKVKQNFKHNFKFCFHTENLQPRGAQAALTPPPRGVAGRTERETLLVAMIRCAALVLLAMGAQC